MPNQSQRTRRNASLIPSRWRVPLIGALLGVLYVDWAVPFMLESSIVAIDGRRYFGLFDDAMISMRYAWNLSHGHGLVWNPGERIEGFTNLLWTLVMSVFTGLMDKVTAVLAVQLLGMLIVLACGLLAWKLARAVTADLPHCDGLIIGAAVAILTLLYYPLSYWTLTGMETGLLTLLLISALLALERYVRGRTGAAGLLVGLFLGLAYLTREDAAMLCRAALHIYGGRAARRGESRLADVDAGTAAVLRVSSRAARSSGSLTTATCCRTRITSS